MDQNQIPHIVMIPTPGMGHLIPMVELAKRVLEAHPFTISFLIPFQGPQIQAQKAVLGALSEGRSNIYYLPAVNVDDLPSDTKIETQIAILLSRSVPAMRSHLKDIQATCGGRLTALVADLFGTDAFDLAPEFGMKPYLFFPSNAMCLSFLLHLEQLDAQVITSEYREMAEPVQLPGCVPLRGIDFPDPIQDRKNDAHKWVLHHGSRYKLTKGILVNTFNEMEEGALKTLQNPKPGFPPVYPVGPLLRTGESDRVDGSECLTWLDDQPRGSVLFVSFGSGGTLSYDQLIELAHGLELSEQRFLWVVRAPNDKLSNANYFDSQKGRDPLNFLPKGYLDRIQGRGLIVPGWAPQVQVLSHEATGGFLIHCGWNSILESVVHGVPMITWPLYAEQRMNAVMLTKGLKIALRPKVDEDGLIKRDEISTVVKGLMVGEEGNEIKIRMKELKEAASRVLSVDGSSTKALSEVILKWSS